MRHPTDDDLETDIEEQLAARGGHKLVPREGLVGAHLERRASLGQGPEEPVGAGADVAPTRKAEARERERHRLQRETVGGSREALDRAAQEADRLIAERHLTAEATTRWFDRARMWVDDHRRETALMAASAAAALAIGTYLAGRDE
jgi:hypothetical protein